MSRSPLDPDLSLPYFHRLAFLQESIRLTSLSRTHTDLRAPVFVVGCPRSGTTVLGNCLAEHPSLGGAGESLFLLDFWRIARDLHGGLNQQAWSPLADYISDSALLETIGEFADSVFAGLLSRLDKPRFVDHTPWYVACIPLIKALYTDSTIVHLLRDGRQVTASLRHSFDQGFRWAGSTVAASSSMWSALVTIGREEGRTLPFGRYVEVRYEDLCEDPERCLRELLDALNLSWHEGILRSLTIPHANPATPKATLATILPNGRLQLEPRKNTSDWPPQWSPKDREEFLDNAGETMLQTGYLESLTT